MKVSQEINSFFIGVKTVLPLANSHMGHFITLNLFESLLPKPIQKEINALGVVELNHLVLNSFSAFKPIENAPYLSEFLEHTKSLHLKESRSCHSLEKLCANLVSKGFSDSSANIVKNLMSVKKSHEVEMMSSIVASLAKSERCSHVVDVGGGKGYLSSVLALNYKLRVLSIDSSDITSKGAAKRIPKVEKLWTILEKKSANKDKSVEFNNDSHTKLQQESSELSKLATLFISDNTNVTELVKEHFPTDDINGVMLVGLHTCGNLAASSLRIFVDDPKNIKCVVNVGCCYHLLVEEFDDSPPWMETLQQSTGVGFPMSAFLREQNFVLGRNARMLAAQPPDKMSQEGKCETESLFYRALLEVYLEKKLDTGNGLPHFKVGKIGQKCSSFIEYVNKSIVRLGLDIEVDNVELQQLYDSHLETRKQLHAFFLLRLAVAPVIEAAIMLDRLLFLQEQGVENAYLTQLFDPVLSPRCFAIIAFNRLQPENS